MGISTTSIANTPQAGNDLFSGVTEDSTGSFIFDVMANDLGGKAKTLYSLDDGSAVSDLLGKDAVGADNFSAHGALIEITADGKVCYTLTAAAKNYFQSLGDGEVGTDTFTYAIQMGNGTLSYATVTVQVSGINDNPALTLVSNTGSVTEDSGHYTTSGGLSFSDVDHNDAGLLTIGAALDTAVYSGGALSSAQETALSGGFLVDGDSWDFSVANSALDFLGAGETVTLTYDVTVQDGHGGSDTEQVTVTLNGSNDDPTLTLVSDTGSVTEDSGTYAASGALSFSDVDNNDAGLLTTDSELSSAVFSGGSLSLAQVVALSGGFSVDGDSWDFSVDNSALQFLKTGETVTLVYDVTVSDGHGGSDTEQVTVTLNGVNEPVVVLNDPNDHDDQTGTNNPTSGADTLVGTSGDDTGLTSISGGSGSDTIYGLAGNDTLNGNSDADIIYGGSGDDIIAGNSGNDQLYGGSGNDTITGNSDNDLIVGGWGKDTMNGNADVDTFKFISTQDSPTLAMADVITNFIAGTDKIDLSAIDSGDGGLGDFDWGGLNSNVVANSVTYYQSGGSTYVQADTTGDTTADFVIQLTGNLTLNQTDFIL